MKLLIWSWILVAGVHVLAQEMEMSPYQRCGSERMSLQNLTRALTSTCKDQISGAARCCAGDANRPECFIASPSIESTDSSINGQARKMISGAQMTAQGLKANIDLCERETSGVQCKASDQLANSEKQRLISAVNRLTACMQTEIGTMVKVQADYAPVERATSAAPSK